jgi:hypothetical protein
MWTSLERSINELFRPTVNMVRSFGVDELKLFNYRRMTVYGATNKAYIGYDSCGPAVYSLSALVQHIYPELRPVIKYHSVGYGRHAEDHVFMEIRFQGENLIIDPTYRQFLYESTPYQDKYENQLFEEMSPFFVGTKERLWLQITSLAKTGGSKVSDIIEKDWWVNNANPPFELDFLDCLKDEKLLATKNSSIKQMIVTLRKEIEKFENGLL